MSNRLVIWNFLTDTRLHFTSNVLKLLYLLFQRKYVHSLWFRNRTTILFTTPIHIFGNSLFQCKDRLDWSVQSRVSAEYLLKQLVIHSLLVRNSVIPFKYHNIMKGIRQFPRQYLISRPFKFCNLLTIVLIPGSWREEILDPLKQYSVYRQWTREFKQRRINDGDDWCNEYVT